MIEIDYGDIMTAHMNNYAGLPVKYIVAGNYLEYKEYVKRKPRIEFYYKYVESVDTIRGLSEINGAFIGTYANRYDIEDIRDMITIIKSKAQIAAVPFQWSDKPAVGFTAQEIAQVLPEGFFNAINGGDIQEYMKR